MYLASGGRLPCWTYSWLNKLVFLCRDLVLCWFHRAHMRNIIRLSPCVQWGQPTLFASFQTNLYTSAMLSNARWYHEKYIHFNIGGSKSILKALSYHFASFKTCLNFSQVSWRSFLGLLQSLISLFQLRWSTYCSPQHTHMKEYQIPGSGTKAD